MTDNEVLHNSIFDLYQLSKEFYNTFEWVKPPGSLYVCPNKTLCDGFLLEHNDETNKDAPHYFILNDMYLIKFQDNNNSLIQCVLNLFMPRITLFQEKGAHKYGFLLTSLKRTKKFYCNSRNELNKWLKSLSQIGILTHITHFYEFKDLIKNKQYSKVHKGKCLGNNLDCTIKSVSKEKLSNSFTLLKMLINEIRMLRSFNHIHIVQLYQVFESQEYVHLIYEYGTDLFEIIKEKGALPEVLAASFILELLNTVNFYHKFNVIHRDLKPENIILTDEKDLNSFKITEFGMATLENEAKKSRCGTEGFTAPEVLAKKEYGKKVDIFSIGIITNILLTGEELEFDPDRKCFFEFRSMEEFNCNEISQLATQFISQLTNKSAENRPTAEEAMNLNWLKARILEESKEPKEPKESKVSKVSNVSNVFKESKEIPPSKSILNYNHQFDVAKLRFNPVHRERSSSYDVEKSKINQVHSYQVEKVIDFITSNYVQDSNNYYYRSETNKGKEEKSFLDKLDMFRVKGANKGNFDVNSNMLLNSCGHSEQLLEELLDDQMIIPDENSTCFKFKFQLPNFLSEGTASRGKLVNFQRKINRKRIKSLQF